MRDFDVRKPPNFCQYAKGQCDQSFADLPTNRLFFMYPGQPAEIATTIEAALEKARVYRRQHPCVGWRDLKIHGRIIFCTICKSLRASDFSVADITTLNFNVLFEIGFSLGLRLAVSPVKDLTYERDAELLKAIGLFDTLGYQRFSNSDDLVQIMSGQGPEFPVSIDALTVRPRPTPTLFLIKSPIDTDNSIHLSSALSRSAFQLSVFDVRETPRLSVQDAIKSVMSTYGTVGHLIDPDRQNATVHNARCAFVCGLAMAAGKPVLMIQDGHFDQPIDYRDVVIPCLDSSQIRASVHSFVRKAMEIHQAAHQTTVTISKSPLASLDLGEPAAENEIEELKGYFVQTAQFSEVMRGRTRLVIGRKGAGKTAMALRIKNSVWKASDLAIDMRPEGHQLVELKEIVLEHLTSGMQEHTLTAFWNYLLTLEIAHAIIEGESNRGSRSRCSDLIDRYAEHTPVDEVDFPSRLLRIVNRVATRFQAAGHVGIGDAAVTGLVYATDIGPLSEAVGAYLTQKRNVWLLVDNLDKGWSTKGATRVDILIVRTLLAAMTKLQKSFAKKKIEFHAITFLRQDIYDQLVDETPDRGKESVVQLAWNDMELVKELVRKRVEESIHIGGEFETAWSQLFDGHVGGTASFRYVWERSLARPRDVLNFLRKAVSVAVNRGHSRVEESDILKAEEGFSQDMFQELFFELRDVFPEYSHCLYGFTNVGERIDDEILKLVLTESGVSDSAVSKVTEILLWYGFLGVSDNNGNEIFSYNVGYDLERLRRSAGSVARTSSRSTLYCIHPAFRLALKGTIPTG